MTSLCLGYRSVNFLSFPLTALADSAPGAPTNVKASPGDSQAVISFSPPAANGGSAVTSYVVTSNPSAITQTGTSSPITVSGLTNGTQYTFTVAASNQTLTGAPSTPSAPVVPDKKPDVPTNVKASPGDSQAVISFSPPAANGGSAVTSYVVTSDIGAITQTGTSSPITIQGLTNRITYKFTVKAKNQTLIGDPSPPSADVTPQIGLSPPVSSGASLGPGDFIILKTYMSGFKFYNGVSYYAPPKSELKVISQKDKEGSITVRFMSNKKNCVYFGLFDCEEDGIKDE